MNARTSAKFPNSGENQALFAPGGSGRPTWAITTPIPSAGVRLTVFVHTGLVVFSRSLSYGV